MKLLTSALIVVAVAAAAAAPTAGGGHEPSRRAERGPPFSRVPSQAVSAEPFSGVIEEIVAAGSYVYLRLDGARWVATPAGPAAVGDRVEVRPLWTQRDFYSRRTGRTFPLVTVAFVDVRDAGATRPRGTARGVEKQ